MPFKFSSNDDIQHILTNIIYLYLHIANRKFQDSWEDEDEEEKKEDDDDDEKSEAKAANKTKPKKSLKEKIAEKEVTN